ncbi:MAG: DUF721 domain-containing protein [Alphaproteobacteria bacterium]|nr:DUF721 domain-containing protein [Alphaproteobacteria bacterium]
MRLARVLPSLFPSPTLNTMDDESRPADVRMTADERRGQGLRSLASTLPRITSSAVRRRGFLEAELVLRWAAIVGPEFAAETLPERLVHPRRREDGATLHVRCAGGFAPTLQHSTPVVLERINRFFGYAAVTGLAIRQSALPDRPVRSAAPELGESEAEVLARRLDGIADPGLRAALEALGRRVLARRP